ncbi:MAG: helix-turn-helix domain-containing protein [Betaproteobacteria bacterium]|nr:MAG: helix-turn-helix domain-containing protein [Betaproteobacteria bacterium]
MIILNETPEQPAQHYLETSSITTTEISLLLGFEGPNSFFRAFHSWTGTTPEQARSVMSRAH